MSTARKDETFVELRIVHYADGRKRAYVPDGHIVDEGEARAIRDAMTEHLRRWQ